MHIIIIPSGRMMTWDNPIGAIFQLDQAKSLNRLGSTVGIISPAPLTINSSIKSLFRFKPSLKSPKEENVYGVNIFRATSQIYYPARFCEKKYVKDFVNEGLKQWKEYIELFGVPDIVHAHNVWCAGILALELKRNGFDGKIVLTEHDSCIVSHNFSKFKTKQYKEVYNLVDKVMVVSTFLKKEIIGKFRLQTQDIEIVPNCINDDVILVRERVKLVSNEATTIVTAGSLMSVKDHETLIRSFADLVKKKNNLELIIIGDGPEKRNLSNLITKLNCNTSIKLVGYKTRAEIGAIFLQSDLFVLPSKHETFGVVLIEALVCGLPCIAFRGSGPDDIITSGNGVLVQERSIKELSNAMLNVINNIEMYDHEIIKKEALDRFSETSIAKQLLRIYHSLA